MEDTDKDLTSKNINNKVNAQEIINDNEKDSMQKACKPENICNSKENICIEENNDSKLKVI